MTTQTIQIVTYDYGASLSSVTLRNISDDSLVATADACNELSTDCGVYAAVFNEASVIAAGTYRLRAVVSGAPINRYVTLAGVDGEVVQTTEDSQAAILDRQAYTLAVLAGACSDPQTASETYVLTIGGSTYTVDMAGQTSTGTRTAPTLTKS